MQRKTQEILMLKKISIAIAAVSALMFSAELILASSGYLVKSLVI
jgi:hypothetical protein